MKNVDIRFPRRQPQAVLLLVAALAALAVGFGLQVAVWRVRVPASQTRVLLLLFLFVYTVMGIALFSGLSVRSFSDLLYVSLLFWAPALCYVLLYTGIESDSPTLTTVLRIFEAGAGGIEHEDLREFLASRSFVRARIRHLLEDGLVEERGDRVRATAAGNASIWPLELHRRLIGRRTRGG